MKFKNNFIYLLIAYVLTGCGNESLSDYTGGVSLGGTGLPTTTGSEDIAKVIKFDTIIKNRLAHFYA